MTSTVDFTELGHVYRTDKGEIVPSVTQVLDLAGFGRYSEGCPQGNIDRAAAVGKAVHVACNLLDEGDLDLDSLDPLIVGYVCAYQRFKEKHTPAWTAIERPLISDGELVFAGTPDRFGTMYYQDLKLVTVLDIKTPKKKEKHWCIQTAGYSILTGWTTGQFRAVVHLKSDGSFTLEPHNNTDDIKVFRAALVVAYRRMGDGAKLK